jgi:polyisoprenoid-binding protein YceI
VKQSTVAEHLTPPSAIQEKSMSSIRNLPCLLIVCSAALGACNSTPDLGKPASAAAWQIDSAKSTMNFVTTKAGQAGVGGVGEVQSFGQFAGGMASDGNINFTVTLASVATGIDIRDERLRTMLFNVRDMPVATFAAQIDPAALRDLGPGGMKDIDVAGELTLAGQSKPLTAKLRVVRLGASQLSVATRAPIVVDAAQFGLKSGVEALRDIMGLNFLATSAPVSLQLLLSEKS